MQLILFCKPVIGLTLQTAICVINQEKQLISTFSSLNQNLLVLCFNACVYLYMPFLSSYILKKKSTGRGGGRGAKPPYARFTPLT